ncbi:hypothetical protein [Flavobacterium sp. 2]|uniref:hypothetical protein n=1 Tax=Flavobacterium sp. 2 TaxID=308053 RepID=UPI003CEFBAE1
MGIFRFIKEKSSANVKCLACDFNYCTSETLAPAEDYNKYINYYGEAPNDAFYEAMAWRGLKENNIKEWTDLTEAKKEEITRLASRATILSKMTPCN